LVGLGDQAFGALYLFRSMSFKPPSGVEKGLPGFAERETAAPGCARYTCELFVLDVVRVVALIVAGSACLRPGHRFGLMLSS
jgi:hypothetical protein